ncbi:MAG: thiamine pyrophosphate-binding protein, partial [Chloroflexota bacterium]
NFLSEVQDYHIDPPGSHRTAGRMRGDRASVEKAADLLINAERPMIFSGHGVVLSEASPELIELAEHLAAPVATSLVGQGGFPKDHPLSVDCPNSVANPAVSHAMKTADVVLAIGTRFGEAETCSWNPDFAFDPWDRHKLIQVDISGEEMGKVYPIAVPIVGDAKAVLAELVTLVRDGSPSRSRDTHPWWQELKVHQDNWAATKAEDEASDEVPIKVQRLLGDLNKVMPAGSIVLVDTGGFGYAVGQHLSINEPQTYYYNLGVGSMGPVMPAALGAKLARPDKKVIAITGDGGFTCQMSGLITAVEYNIPVLYLVVNNYSYNSIEAYQHKHFDGRVLGTAFVDRQGKPYNPDFVALAKACGADGLRVENPEDLTSAFEKALASPIPFVLDVVCGQTRFPKAYGYIDFNDILSKDAQFKRDRAAQAG